jgi:hypothetical protein
MHEEPELPAWAKRVRAPRRPETRPTWVVVLAVAMTVFGARFLLLGINQFATLHLDFELDETLAAQLPPERKVISDAIAKARLPHPVAVRANAVSRVVLGGLLLFAVAAVFTSDPRARWAAMIAAAAEIAFQVGDGLFLFLISRHELAAIAPTFMGISHAGNLEGVSPAAFSWMAGLSLMAIGLPGIVFSVVLLAFFGGNRGRTFFGAGAAADARPL